MKNYLKVFLLLAGSISLFAQDGLGNLDDLLEATPDSVSVTVVDTAATPDSVSNSTQNETVATDTVQIPQITEVPAEEAISIPTEQIFLFDEDVDSTSIHFADIPWGICPDEFSYRIGKHGFEQVDDFYFNLINGKDTVKLESKFTKDHLESLTMSFSEFNGAVMDTLNQRFDDLITLFTVRYGNPKTIREYIYQLDKENRVSRESDILRLYIWTVGEGECHLVLQDPRSPRIEVIYRSTRYRAAREESFREKISRLF